MKIASILDYREAARRKLPSFLFEYIDGGSSAEVTLWRNVDDQRGVALRQRVMRDVNGTDLTTTLFGKTQSMQIALSAAGVWPLAEIAAGTLRRFGQAALGLMHWRRTVKRAWHMCFSLSKRKCAWRWDSPVSRKYQT